MSLAVNLIDSATEKCLGIDQAGNFSKALVTVGPYDRITRFTAANRALAGTTDLIAPLGGGCIVVRDIIVSAKKLNAKNVQLFFTDDIETVTLFDMDNTDGIQIAMHFAGIWQGWADARLAFTTDGAFNCNVSVSYARLDGGLTYSEWSS